MKQTRIVSLLGIILAVITFFIGHEVGKAQADHNITGICTNNETRDYAYEAYCDSIWEADKAYYLDVLTETNEYCQYIEKHGSWWHNEN